jgi:hypothetical protein
MVNAHIVSGMKRGRLVKGLFRNTKEKYDDLGMEIACGWHHLRGHCWQSEFAIMSIARFQEQAHHGLAELVSTGRQAQRPPLTMRLRSGPPPPRVGPVAARFAGRDEGGPPGAWQSQPRWACPLLESSLPGGELEGQRLASTRWALPSASAGLAPVSHGWIVVPAGSVVLDR